jgi:hypothetical protein
MPPAAPQTTTKPVCFEILAAESNVQDEQVTCVFWAHVGGRVALRMSLALAKSFSADLARRSGALPQLRQRQIVDGRPWGRGTQAARREFYDRLLDEFSRSNLTLTAFAESKAIRENTLSMAFIKVRARRAAPPSPSSSS